MTLRDVARAAGVTSITVSRYLREPQIVAADTTERIRRALAETGYVPNRQAGLLASGVSNIVAALLPNLANSIFAETAQGLSDTLQSAGYELLIAATGFSLEREEEQLRALLAWRPAAVVVTGRRHSKAAHVLLEAARKAGTPVIEVWDHARDEEAVTAPRYTQVGFSHDAIGRAMADHLLDAGHRHVIFVDSGVVEDYRAHERGLAFVARARERGATARVRVAPPGDTFDAGRQVLRSLWAATGRPPTRPGSRPTAAAFANDHLACGALLEARRIGIAVPGQFALLGFGDFALARQLEPALSSVSLPRYDIGVTAAQALLDSLTGRGRAPSYKLPWAIVPRSSTGPPTG